LERLYFSWLIPGEVAGHSAPESENDLSFLKQLGLKALVRMVESHKVLVTGEQIEALGLIDFHVPVPVFTAPGASQIDTMVAFVKSSVAAKNPVGVSCGAGIGRTGTILACYLVEQGYSADQALAELKDKRGAGVETTGQIEAVREYARRQDSNSRKAV
jgi:atypical dual specificity phosphatase